MFNNIITTKQSIINAISAHPKLLALGIGLAITMAIGITTGFTDNSNHLAFAGGGCIGCHTS